MADDVASVYAELRAVLKSEIEGAMAQFVTGSKDIDKDWDAYVDNLYKLGMDKYLKLYQQEYDRSMKN